MLYRTLLKLNFAVFIFYSILLISVPQAFAQIKNETLSKSEIRAKSEIREAGSSEKIVKEKIIDDGSVEIKIVDDFFEIKKNHPELAIQKMGEWKPKKPEEGYYKNFFLAQLKNSPKDFWELYKTLKKSKKLSRVQLESLKAILEFDLANADSKKTAVPIPIFKKEAKILVRRMNSLPEGLDFELKYLQWIRKYQVNSELCKPERNRWLAQVSLDYSEIASALAECPIDFDDFLYRMRMLIFSGEEKKAQAELNSFIADKTTDKLSEESTEKALQKTADKSVGKSPEESTEESSEKLAAKSSDKAADKSVNSSTKNPMKDWQKAYLQAIFYSNIGDPISAFKQVKDFEKELLASEDYRNNLFYIAQRAGELEKAEDLINKIIEQTVTVKEKRENLFQKGFLYYQTRKYKQAIALFDRLIKTHPSHKARRKNSQYDDLTWLKSWCLYLDKNYAEAKIEFIANKAWTRDKARNLYWLAQTEWALDNQFDSLDYFKQLAQPLLKGEFFNYYNLLGWLRFESYKTFVKSNILANQISIMKSGRGLYFLPDDLTNPLRIVSEYRTYFEDLSQTDEGDIQIVNQDTVVAAQSESEIAIEGTADLRKQMKWADALVKWGYPDFAKWHLYEVEKSLKKRHVADPLIQHYIDRKLHNRALSLMQKLTSTQQKKISLRDDDLLWKSIYPRAYQLNVSAESLNRRISPNLIWAIMKAETQYKHDAISPVGAVGLMQFMPYTSQKVATLMREDHELHRLFQPEVAIQYGAAYLKKLSVEFDDQLPLIAAAYNGGPHRVKLWLRNFGAIDFDTFIEHIPFGETRTYVKRVLNFFVTYQKIYDEKIDIKKVMFLTEKNPYQIKEPISLKEEWDIPIR
ncbi:MAG: hypothetical protein A2622_01720 [Bdellovibrionales bacterium RIFCSPHIGHO2_01_FULL_40_29]|nr:MAG: hypothetical protein A2622_01720 [Bdellovibrionales bacterium RIFCSPHIGHO2_01_FULL_40_29]OFZ33813.1 MAG: hypothetical protein A3D17_02140 [Bdellovibrionales bacterium RIFCSPHIGHO2_02_FULL_40_15]